MPKLTKKVALEKLDRGIKQIDEVKAKGRRSPDFKKWYRDTEIDISYVFGEKSRHLNDFDKISYSLGAFHSRTPDSAFEDAFRRGMESARAILQSMVQEVQEYWDEEERTEQIDNLKPSEPANKTKDIFVIHGHDEGLKDAVARFLSKIELNPIILHEQPNQGRTIIEKFEAHASTPYAVALFTPDDIGGSAKSPESLQPRARQNVVFEFGYFIGKLGRNNVTAIYQEGVELPSDYLGVVYIPLDPNGNWKFLLVKELKSAGFIVDANKAL
ncbi:MAG: nucleotide-binding protein [Ignavibacteriae bacterium]|nr:nucleotide-binding protein [Ignavibacteriota bacterium]